MEEEIYSTTLERFEKLKPQGSVVSDREILVFYLQETTSPLMLDDLVARVLNFYLDRVFSGHWSGEVGDYLQIKTDGCVWNTQKHTIVLQKSRKKGDRLAFLPVGRIRRQYIYIEKITNLAEVVKKCGELKTKSI